jgi:endonuclease/exonuclease/phosphatase family metal-dependent hydrolase
MLISRFIQTAFVFLLLLPSAFAGEPSFIFDRLQRGITVYPEELKAKHDEDTLNVFWWNTREGGKLSKTQNQNPLEKNLVQLVQSEYAPDVLILGEFVPGSMNPDTEFALNLQYPYRAYTPYARKRTDMGIEVYSRFPFTKTASLLDWSPYHDSKEEQAKFKQKWRQGLNPDADRVFERVFLDIRIQKYNRVFHVVPVHLLNPWLPLSAQLGRTKAGLVMMFGDDNPHYRQVERLMLEKVRPLLVQVKREQSSFVMIGDFNLPDELFGISPIGFELINLYLKPSVNPLFSSYTFPAVSSDMTEQTQLRIDHAFVNRSTRVRDEARIPFMGSDHYPIGVRIESR